jgi:outer membrane lipoprotein-sorting protein
MQVRRNRQIFIMLLIAAFFLPACSSLVDRISQKPKDFEVSAEARELLERLENQNRTLKTFKGTGKVTFRGNKKKNLTYRIVWIAAVPGKLRIAVRSFSGQPVVSFASDGQWFYSFSHVDSKFYKQSVKNTTLKRFLSIPINSGDIVSILGGGIPLIAYNKAVVEKKESEDRYVLILKKRWGNVFQKIYFNKNKNQVLKMEMFGMSGVLAYRAEFCGMQTIKGYQVPACLVFSNAEGREFQLDIERYWADVEVSPSAFVLTPLE